ncbi:hypothetical protein PF011_g13149 [Phytophthora fragariae]|nr:hypothetical protein PF011_g13149 [Phytophthora fragariae]
MLPLRLRSWWLCCHWCSTFPSPRPASMAARFRSPVLPWLPLQLRARLLESLAGPPVDPRSLYGRALRLASVEVAVRVRRVCRLRSIRLPSAVGSSSSS